MFVIQKDGFLHIFALDVDRPLLCVTSQYPDSQTMWINVGGHGMSKDHAPRGPDNTSDLLQCAASQWGSFHDQAIYTLVRERDRFGAPQDQPWYWPAAIHSFCFDRAEVQIPRHLVATFAADVKCESRCGF